MGRFNALQFIDQYGNNPNIWLEQTSDKLKKGTYKEPEQVLVGHQHSNKMFKWVNDPKGKEVNVNGAVLEEIASNYNQVLEYVRVSDDKTCLNRAKDVLNNYAHFVTTYCPTPIRGYQRYHPIKRKDDTLSVERVAIYYKWGRDAEAQSRSNT